MHVSLCWLEVEEEEEEEEEEAKEEEEEVKLGLLFLISFVTEAEGVI